MTPTNGKRSASPGVVTALLYTRVSKEEMQRDGLSLPTQTERTRQYAAGEGWIIGAEFQDVMKGTRDDRPGYRALLEEVRRLRQQGQAAAVVVLKLDRLGRRLLERVRCREELKALGVPTHSVLEGGEVSDLVANILGSVAEEEVRQLGERVSAVRQSVAERGWYFPGRLPWGYRTRPATPEERALGAPRSVLEPDPLAAPVVRELFHRAAAGASIKSLLAWIATLPAEARGGRVLGHRAILGVLRSQVYLAEGKRWPALIDPETWAKVQALLDGHRRVPRQGGKYLLTGLLWCPRCSHRMTGVPPVNGATERKPARYMCRADRPTLERDGRMVWCQYQVPLALIDEMVLASVGEIVSKVLAAAETSERYRQLHQAWEAPLGPSVDTVRADLARVEAAIGKAHKRLTTAARMLVDGDLDKQSHDLLVADVKRELAGLDAEKARLSEQVRVLSTGLSLDAALDLLREGRRAVTESDLARQREVLKQLIERIEPVRLGRAAYGLRIAWTPLGGRLHRLAMTSAVGEDGEVIADDLLTVEAFDRLLELQKVRHPDG